MGQDMLPEGVRWAGPGEPEILDVDAIVHSAVDGLAVNLSTPRINHVILVGHEVWARGRWTEARAAWERQITLPRWQGPYPNEAGGETLAAVEARLTSALTTIDMASPCGRMTASEILSDYLAPIVEDLGRPRDAADLCRRARALAEPVLGPTHPRLMHVLEMEANLFGRLGLGERADACWERAGEIRGMWRAREEAVPSGDPAELEAHYTAVLARHPRYLLARVLRGEQRLRLGDRDGVLGGDPHPTYMAAIEDFRADTGGYDEHPASLMLTGIAHQAIGDAEAGMGLDARQSWEAAAETYTRVLKRNHGIWRARERRAAVFERLGLHDRAATEYGTLIRWVGGDPHLEESLARAMAAAGPIRAAQVEESVSIPVVERPSPEGAETCVHVVLEVDDESEAATVHEVIANRGRFEDSTVTDYGATGICPATAGHRTNQVRVECWNEDDAIECAEGFRDEFGLVGRCAVETGIPYDESVESDNRYCELARMIDEHGLDVDPSGMGLDDLRGAIREALVRRIESAPKEDADDLHDALGSIEEGEG